MKQKTNRISIINPRPSLRSLGAFLVLTAALGLSCAPRHPTPYGGLRETPESYDRFVLRDRLIVIDPGHGGPFAGAVGPGGTREADVNLKVALELAALCQASGARVVLTRNSDSDVGAGPDESLIDDLEARSAIANDAGADCFISIHHNN
ncbi:N-acetylmuramoyl-L-alanine amidase, partial [candidate division KSB1 bacterium]